MPGGNADRSNSGFLARVATVHLIVSGRIVRDSCMLPKERSNGLPEEDSTLPASYDLKKAKDGQFMFNLRAANGEIILTSERYTTRSGAKRGIESVRKNSATGARFERKPSGTQFIFRLRATNGKIIGASERYTTQAALEKGIASVMTNAPKAPVREI